MWVKHVNIYYYFLHFSDFFPVCVLKKIWPGNIIIYHQNFYFVVIICIFILGSVTNICRVRYLSDELR